MDILVELLGRNGVMAVIGAMAFIYVYRYSIELFDLIEKHTMGNKNYILEKLEFLFIEIKPDYITYLLLFFSFGISVLLLGIFGMIGNWTGGIILAIFMAIVGWKIPKPIINYLVYRRIKNYQNQLVDSLTLLGNGLRAGMSLPQSVGMVVEELSPPVSQEFNIILQQNKIGVPLEECFEDLVKRIPTEDNEMFVSSVNILRETGGNLPEVFDTIISVIRERIRLQQKIDTFVAQGLFQGATIALMPFFLMFVYYLNDPEQMKMMFTTGIGIAMLVVAVILDAIGAFIIFKIVSIKV